MQQILTSKGSDTTVTTADVEGTSMLIRASFEADKLKKIQHQGLGASSRVSVLPS